MSNKKLPVSLPLIIQPMFSKKMAIFIAFLHSTALIGIWLASLDMIIQLFLSCYVFLMLYFNIKKQLFFKYRQPIQNITLINDYFLFPDKTVATILPYVYVHSKIVILPLALKNKKTEILILFDDSLDKTTFHYLRVRLLHPITN
ncbi:MAG: hypothetical protein RIT27_2113 [Pseudomonadota bacterium]|jgi:hypothetical protein